jgi:hypothetical protein
VVEVGSAVERFKIGERVVAALMPAWVTGPFRPAMAGSVLGSAADGVLRGYVTGDQRHFVAAPEGFSFEEASTLPRAALTAWNALFEQDDLRPGYRAVTWDGIARKVRRARTSLYRRWPSKRHLVAYAVLSELGASPAADTGRFVATCRPRLEPCAGRLADRSGKHYRAS